jgi:hypothetical protein
MTNIKINIRGPSMAVTSVNHNPGNDSSYARHRSIWKGSKNQLRDTVASLQGTPGVKVYEYWDTPLDIIKRFKDDWGVNLKVSRAPPKGRQVLGTWTIASPSHRMMNAVGGNLRADLKLLWDDFMLITAQRIGWSGGAGAENISAYSGKSLLVFATGPSSFDLIVSKYGYGENLKHNHHFYQWQARDKSFQGFVSVEDYTTDDGLTLYVVN